MNALFSIDQLRSGGKGINTAGGWLTALLGRMLTDTTFEFACASFGKTRRVQAYGNDRIASFVIPKGWDKSGEGLRRCRDLVNEWEPDLIHIHGTEEAYGLLTARGMVKCPAVVSLQGLMGPYSEWYRYFGNAKLVDVIRMHRLLEIPAFRGQWIMFRRFGKAAKREREIIAGNRFFMGRTAWDRAYIRALNPSAQYFHGGELLREAFWHEQWNIGRARRHRIIFTNAGHPRKGTETLLDAVKLLQPHFPDIQVGIAGGISRRSGYGRYVRRRIEELGHAAIELGQLNAEEMVKELANSHVFVSPSFIDNSPNAVCEAQLLV
jgi:glycosyltransferase involved in cell wall biosynthesis